MRNEEGDVERIGTKQVRDDEVAGEQDRESEKKKRKKEDDEEREERGSRNREVEKENN